MKVAIVGAGLAGTGAAWAARRRGFDVDLVSDGFGATRLYGGILDGASEEVRQSGELLAFESALGLWHPHPAHVATSQGDVRLAARSDAALLDLELCAGRTVSIADVARDDWDAELLAQALGASSWAKQTRTRFVSVAVAGLEHGYERRIAAADFAELHDESSRLERLSRELTRAASNAEAWLLGPWLGAKQARADALRQLLGVPVGETTSPLGGAAGVRFDHARDALLGELDVTVHDGSVRRVDPGSPAVVHFTDRAAEPRAVSADAVVIATGGLVGGGFSLVARDSQHLLGPFKASIEGPFAIAVDGQVKDNDGSLFGLDFTEQGFGVLERVGFATEVHGRMAKGVYAVGHARFDVARGGLDALLSAFATVRALAL